DGEGSASLEGVGPRPPGWPGADRWPDRLRLGGADLRRENCAVTGHLEIVLGGLVALFVVIVLVDRLVFRRHMERITARLPEADRAAFTTRYRLLRRAVEAVIVFIGLLAILFSFDQTRAAAQTVL